MRPHPDSRSVARTPASRSIPKMSELSPSQRTASTARFLLGTGSLVALEAMWQGSVARTLLASAVLAMGGTLLFFAKRAD